MRATSSCSQESKGSITSMSCGRSKFEVADSFACNFSSAISLSCFFIIVDTYASRLKRGGGGFSSKICSRYILEAETQVRFEDVSFEVQWKLDRSKEVSSSHVGVRR